MKNNLIFILFVFVLSTVNSQVIELKLNSWLHYTTNLEFNENLGYSFTQNLNEIYVDAIGIGENIVVFDLNSKTYSISGTHNEVYSTEVFPIIDIKETDHDYTFVINCIERDTNIPYKEYVRIIKNVEGNDPVYFSYWNQDGIVEGNTLKKQMTELTIK